MATLPAVCPRCRAALIESGKARAGEVCANCLSGSGSARAWAEMTADDIVADINAIVGAIVEDGSLTFPRGPVMPRREVIVAVDGDPDEPHPADAVCETCEPELPGEEE